MRPRTNVNVNANASANAGRGFACEAGGGAVKADQALLACCKTAPGAMTGVSTFKAKECAAQGMRGGRWRNQS